MAESLGLMSMNGLLPIPIETISCIRSSDNHTCTHTQHTRTYAHTHIHTHTHTHTHTRTHSRTHARTHARTHTTHTHTCTHMHTQFKNNQHKYLFLMLFLEQVYKIYCKLFSAHNNSTETKTSHNAFVNETAALK